MGFGTFKSVFAALGVVAATACAGAADENQMRDDATTQTTETYNLIDFIMLAEGAELAERNAYEEALEPIAARYGAEYIHTYNLVSHIGGPMDSAVRLNIWEFEDQNALALVNEDEDYKALIPMRDRVHDMDALTLYMAQPIKDGGPIGDGVVLVDLIVMQDGAGDAERNAYEARMAPIAEKYGFRVHSAFRILQKIGGEGPESPIRLNLWAGQDPEGLQRLSQDPEYQELVEMRNRIHDMEQIALFLAAPCDDR